MPDERRKSILSIIDEYGEISLTELSSLFPDVSSMTIRRDLSELENRGSIIRTRGGAVSIRKINSSYSHHHSGEENEYSLRAREAIVQKQIIAKTALSFVEKGRAQITRSIISNLQILVFLFINLSPSLRAL